MKQYEELFRDEEFVHIILIDDFEKTNVKVAIEDFEEYTKDMMEI